MLHADGHVWVIRHPDPTFRGVFAGVDFYNGIGSTGMVDIVCKLLDSRAGFKILGLSDEEKREFRILRDQLKPKPPIRIDVTEGAWSALK